VCVCKLQYNNGNSFDGDVDRDRDFLHTKLFTIIINVSSFFIQRSMVYWSLYHL